VVPPLAAALATHWEQGCNDAPDLLASSVTAPRPTISLPSPCPHTIRGEHISLAFVRQALILDWIAGYGFKPIRSFLTYLFVVGGFAILYFLMRDSVHPSLNPIDALIFSITSFHGRGFNPGETVTLHSPLTTAAAVEAIIDLLIEITFIATFTNRFFAR
jgi:hypothetical protein